MKRFCHILSGLVALGAAVSVQAMSLGLRMTLWNRSAREAPSYPVGETLAADAQSASLTWTVGTNGVASVKGYDDATATGGKSVKFTAADNASVWIEGVVSNTCRVSFDWKCSCEPFVKGRPYDYMAFWVDGVQQDFICGETGWTNMTFYVIGEGVHHLRWTYQKDERDSAGEDCAWLANVSVVPSVTVEFDGGGATAGGGPEPMTAYADESIVLPGQGTLAWPKHTFLGWSDGATLYGSGDPYPCGGALLLTAQWAVNTLSAPVIMVPATYEADSVMVTITADVGTSIYYTLDGSTPGTDGSGSRLYQGAFEVIGNATIRAIAVRDDYFDSDLASVTVTRLTWTLGEYLNWSEQTFTMSGDAGWTRVKGVSADGYALRSGVISHSQTSRLDTVVSGPGTVSFKWRASCEDYFVFRTQKILCDHLLFLVDGEPQGIVNGETDWTNATFTVEGAGEHQLTWAYVKDSEESEGEDCAWLDMVTWTPGVESRLAAWLAERNLTADARAANGRTAAECYALGLDPANATNDFRIVSIEIVDGKPKVEWEPKVNRWTGAEIQAVLKGAATLDGEWQTVTEENKAGFRFFKVVVEVP